MERMVAAMLRVDDEIAFRSIDDGPIAYLDRRVGRLRGISLDDAFIVDYDEDDRWNSYINYLVKWVFDNYAVDDCGSPLPYDLWQTETYSEH